MTVGGTCLSRPTFFNSSQANHKVASRVKNASISHLGCLRAATQNRTNLHRVFLI